MKQSNDYTSGPQWGAGLFATALGLCLLAAIAGRAASTGDVSVFTAPLIAIGFFFLSFGLYAFVPGRVRLRMEPWATVALGGFLALFLIGVGVVSIAQAHLLPSDANTGFRAPNTPTEARVEGVLLIVLGLMPAIGAVMAPVRYFRRDARQHHPRSKAQGQR